MNENIFRIAAALILFTGVGISSYYRRKADKDSGEKISRKVDGTVFMNIIKIGALILWFSPLVYLINPAWMAWSKIGLPEWVRWLGVGIGVLCIFGIYWLFGSIGSGITPTSATPYGNQGAHGSKPNATAIAQGNASSVPAAKKAAGMLTSTRYTSGNMRGRTSKTACR